MNALWMRQLGAVVSLEWKKSFFNRRSLWIYLLAALPMVIFGGHALETKFSRERLARQRTPEVTMERVRTLREGMTNQEVEAILGQAPSRHSRGGRRNRIQIWRYSDGQSEINVRFRDGALERWSVNESCSVSEDLHIFAGVYQFFFLRLMVFFGCVFVFLNLFRGEMLDKSLHYYFLAPIRREVVVAGKFIAGLIATSVIFGTSVALQLGALYWHFDGPKLEQYMSQGGGWQHSLAYVAITGLACLGYGSVFLTGGMLLKNPLIPAAVILVWESINGVLPAMLRKLSVIYYLKSLCPVEIPIDKGVPPFLAMLVMNVEPVAPWIAVLGLVALSGAMVTLAARRSRTLEIQYGAE